MHLLKAQYRLDRLTSGLVVMGKNFKSSQIIDSHIKNRTAEKKYVCRVIGEFPKYIISYLYNFQIIISTKLKT